MKKILTIISISALLLAVSHSTWAQLSIRPEVGYQFPMAGGLLSTENTSSGTTGVYGSLGQGFEFGADFDYKFCACFQLELGARYWDGAAITSNSVRSDGSGGTITDNNQSNLHLVTISLGDFYDFCCDDDAFVPYLGFGIDFGIGGSVKQTENETDINPNASPSTLAVDGSVAGNLALGGYAEFGAKYHLSSHLSVFGQIRIDALSVTPNKFTVSSYVVNGVDQTSMLTAEKKETDYYKSIPSSYTPSSGSPAEGIATPQPASAWGINIGIDYNFGSWSKTSKGSTK